jgi:hypothetical protein
LGERRLQSRGFFQRFEAGDNVEEFFVNATLVQSMKTPVEVHQQFVNILSARCMATRRLAFSLVRDSQRTPKRARQKDIR